MDIYDLFRMVIEESRDFYGVEGGPGLAIHSVERMTDGSIDYDNSFASDYHVEDLFASQVALSNKNAVVLITETVPGEYDIEAALRKDKIVARCYACGWLYLERDAYQGARTSHRDFDPTDYECGCVLRAMEAEYEEYEVLFGNFEPKPVRP